MKKLKAKERSPLVKAAEVLDEELATFERLSDSMKNEALDSQKGLDRAATLLRQVADAEERLQTAVRTLLEAIGGARDRQSTHAETVNARAQELAQRTEVFRGLLARYQTLGAIVAKVTEAMVSLGKARHGENKDEVTAALPDLIEGVKKAAESAKELVQAAHDAGFSDVARNTDSMRQQVLAAQNKMSLLRERLSSTGEPEHN